MAWTYDTLRELWPRSVGTENLGIRSLIRRIEDADDPLILDPDYQRGRVWTDDQCARFVGFLMEGGTAPVIFVQRWPNSVQPDEILDGLQRITACVRFYRNEIPLELSDGTRMFLRDFSPDDQRKMVSPVAGPTLVFQFVQNETRAEVLQMYLRLNRGGTVHSDAEINRVRELLDAEREA